MRVGPTLLPLLLAAGAAAAQAEPDRLTAGAPRHAVTIRVEPQPGEAAAAGRDLRVTIAYREPGTDRPVPALRPRAWIRRSGAGPGCADAAWMVRASGAISPADLPLERSFLLALSAATEGGEDRVAVIDQGHRLRSADHVSVTTLGARAGGLALHPSRPRLLATRPERGDVVAVALPWGGLVPVASGLRRPGPLAPLGDGLAVIEEEGGLVLLGPDGLRRAEAPLGPPPRRLLAPDAGGLAVAAADGSALVVRRDGARTALPAGTLGALAEAGPGVLVDAGGEASLRLRWLDDPTRAIPVALPFVPGGLAVHGAGRFALAWDRDGTRAVPVDLAAARALAPFGLPGPVASATTAASALVLAHRDAAFATVIDLAPLAADAAASPALRRIRLPGPAGTDPGLAGGADRPSAALLVSGSGTVALVAAGGGLSDQPAATVAIRGDRPRAIAWFDQRLAEEEPGTFATTVRLVAGGRYEVVTTTGPGGTTACAGFAVAGPAPPEEAAAALAVVSAPARAGEAGLLRLRIENRPGWLRGGAVGLRIQDLELGAAARVRADLGEDAVVTAAVTFPEPGTYAVSVEAGAGAIAPAVIGVAP
ncbi:hypothetical protein [uncultured Methylobacterium sp.]|jgi:hypothetical protein|uniref:hypothetical protein n=1 Tax=uncultured Methylobacterium sp. TaxID=157278 RepID=UPI00260F294A|nr:hypothetical protein [uncultured Methylobacterium sp.]